jgi:hypothetical protein
MSGIATPPLFHAALDSLGALVPHGGLLDAAELESVAAGIVDAGTSSSTRTTAWTRGY